MYTHTRAHAHMYTHTHTHTRKCTHVNFPDKGNFKKPGVHQPVAGIYLMYNNQFKRIRDRLLLQKVRKQGAVF